MERTPVIDGDPRVKEKVSPSRGAGVRPPRKPQRKAPPRELRPHPRLRRLQYQSATSPEEILDSLGAIAEEERQREVAKVLLALEWARLNPAKHAALAPRVDDGSRRADPIREAQEIWLALAEFGCFHVDELSVPAFAEAARISEFKARTFLAEAMLLVMLLPKVWKRAADGHIDVWRAMKLAAECWELTPDAVGYVDHHMSKTNARHTPMGRAGIIEEAKIRFMAEQVEEEKARPQETRGVYFDFQLDQQAGLAHIAATMSLLDGIDLKLAIEAGAKHLKDQGSEAPLGVRQAWALGDLARSSKHLPAKPLIGSNGSSPIDGPDAEPQSDRPRWSGTGTGDSNVMVYLHLTAEAFIGGEFSNCTPIRVEGKSVPRGTVLTPMVIQEWFNRPHAGLGHKVIVRPVIDLGDHHHVDAYEVPDRIKELVRLRDGGCVFPWCTRKAWSTDCDHIEPWKKDGTGGPTCSCNLAPLCRRHHRAKTHADNHIGSPYTWWTYESLGEGKYLWHGPNNTVLLRTATGVFEVPSKAPPPKRTMPAALKTVEKISKKVTSQIGDRLQRPPPRPPQEQPIGPVDLLGQPPPF